MPENKRWTFPKLTLVFYCPYLCAATGAAYLISGKDSLPAFIAGSAVSVVLFGVTASAARRMVGGSVNTVLAFVVVGFMVRFITVLAVVAIVHFVTEWSLITFFLGVLGSYIVLQILELTFVQKRLIKRVDDQHERLE